MADNIVTIVGNVTRDPELRFSQAGLAIVSLGVAHNQRRMVNGKWEDGDVSFFDVTIFGQTAENVADSITKGTRVVVFGRLTQDTWEDKDTGDKRSKVKIIAEEVAPSLRFATAQLTKVTKSGDSPSYTPTDGSDEPF